MCCEQDWAKACPYLCSLRGKWQWLIGNTLGMEMTLETRLSFTKPCTYRPLLSAEIAVLNCVNWPRRSSLGGTVGRSRIGDAFARGREQISLHTHFVPYLSSPTWTCVPLRTEHMQDIHTTAQALMGAFISYQACPQVPAPDGSKGKPSCVQGCCRTSCVTRAEHLPRPRATTSCILFFFSLQYFHSMWTLRKCSSECQDLIRMPAERFHHKWLIKLKYCVCL